MVSLDDVERAGDYGVDDELCRRIVLAGGTVLAVRTVDVPGGSSAVASGGTIDLLRDRSWFSTS